MDEKITFFRSKVQFYGHMMKNPKMICVKQSIHQPIFVRDADAVQIKRFNLWDLNRSTRFTCVGVHQFYLNQHDAIKIENLTQIKSAERLEWMLEYKKKPPEGGCIIFSWLGVPAVAVVPLFPWPLISPGI